MKPLLCCFFLLSIAASIKKVQGQTAILRYQVVNTLMRTSANGIKQKLADLEYDGYLYQQGNRNIYFEKPLYLNKYLSGSIDIWINENESEGYSLSMDTMQSILYKDFDSMIFRNRLRVTGSTGVNLYQNFTKVTPQEWELLPDTMLIGGLHCQKAHRKNNQGAIMWVVWFCADVPITVGPSAIYDLPGIIVEAESSISNKKISLVSYQIDVSLPDWVFWPGVFNEPFSEMKPFSSEKQKKLSEISNQ